MFFIYTVLNLIIGDSWPHGRILLRQKSGEGGRVERIVGRSCCRIIQARRHQHGDRRHHHHFRSVSRRVSSCLRRKIHPSVQGKYS